MEEPKSQPIEQKIEEKKVEKVKGPGLFSRIKGKLTQYKRVLEVSQKPDKEDFLSSMKITGAGILFIGIIGFIIFLLYLLLPKLFGA
jgi:protein transport protein SEC61 subunit gamma-like protein